MSSSSEDFGVAPVLEGSANSRSASVGVPVSLGKVEILAMRAAVCLQSESALLVFEVVCPAMLDCPRIFGAGLCAVSRWKFALHASFTIDFLAVGRHLRSQGRTNYDL